MQIYIHQTHHTIADFENIFKYLEDQAQQGVFKDSIHIFPELFLTGYPLQDLCLTNDFIEGYEAFCQKLKSWWKAQDFSDDCALLMGGLKYHMHGDIPNSIENVVYELSNRANLESIYTKVLLPSYDIFDETKYFVPGKESKIWEFNGSNFGILICEDMWSSPQYDFDPVSNLYDLSQGKKLNGVFNFSASPTHLGKNSSRLARSKEIAKIFNSPYFYVNRVGGEDEIIFDGGSFIVDKDKVLAACGRFIGETINYELPKASAVPKSSEVHNSEHSWESLFETRLNDKNRLMELSDEECEEILHTLNLGMSDYARKCGMNKFLVALSGGIDSVLVLTLVKMFLKPGQEVEAIYMPGQFSATLSWEISMELCKNLGVKLTTLPIKFLHSSVKNQFDQSFETLEGLADENIQSRLRGALLYARSNQTGAMVLNTSNKSELAVGYSTLYGDSVGALSLIGDLYKSEVYQLANFINKKYNNIIPDNAISRPPSAELRENQEDQDSLPPYDILDAILEGHLSYRYSVKDLIDLGLDGKDVIRTVRLVNIAEYKRYQFCPVIKLKSKSFGFGRRIPISKKF